MASLKTPFSNTRTRDKNVNIANKKQSKKGRNAKGYYRQGGKKRDKRKKSKNHVCCLSRQGLSSLASRLLVSDFLSKIAPLLATPYPTRHFHLAFFLVHPLTTSGSQRCTSCSGCTHLGPGSRKVPGRCRRCSAGEAVSLAGYSGLQAPLGHSPQRRKC